MGDNDQKKRLYGYLNQKGVYENESDFNRDIDNEEGRRGVYDNMYRSGMYKGDWDTFNRMLGVLDKEKEQAESNAAAGGVGAVADVAVAPKAVKAPAGDAAGTGAAGMRTAGAGVKPAADAAGTEAGGMRPADVSAGTGQAGTGERTAGAGERPAADAAGTGAGTAGIMPTGDAAGTRAGDAAGEAGMTRPAPAEVMANRDRAGNGLTDQKARDMAEVTEKITKPLVEKELRFLMGQGEEDTKKKWEANSQKYAVNMNQYNDMAWVQNMMAYYKETDPQVVIDGVNRLLGITDLMMTEEEQKKWEKEKGVKVTKDEQGRIWYQYKNGVKRMVDRGDGMGSEFMSKVSDLAYKQIGLDMNKTEQDGEEGEKVSKPLSDEEQKRIMERYNAQFGRIIERVQQDIYDYLKQSESPKDALDYVLTGGIREAMVSKIVETLLTKASGSSGLREQLRAQAENDYMSNASFWGGAAQGATRGVVSLSMDAVPLLMAEMGGGFVGGQIAKGVGSAVMASGAKRAVVKAVMKYVPQVVSSAWQFGNYDMAGAAIQQFADGRFSADELAQAWTHGAETGGALGMINVGVDRVAAGVKSRFGRGLVHFGGYAGEVGFFSAGEISGMIDQKRAKKAAEYMEQGMSEEEANKKAEEEIGLKEVNWGEALTKQAMMIAMLKAKGAMENRLSLFAGKDGKLKIPADVMAELSEYDVAKMLGNGKRAGGVSVNSEGKGGFVANDNDADVARAEEWQRMMADENVSMEAKNLMTVLMFGAKIQTAPVAGVDVNSDNGMTTVTKRDAAGNILSRRTVKDGEEGELVAAAMNEIRLNSIYNTESAVANPASFVNKAMMEEAKKQSMSYERIAEIVEAAGEEGAANWQKKIADSVNERVRAMAVAVGVKGVDEIRREVEDATGVDLAEALKAGKPTEEQSDALNMYQQRLSEMADRLTDENRAVAKEVEVTAEAQKKVEEFVEEWKPFADDEGVVRTVKVAGKDYKVKGEGEEFWYYLDDKGEVQRVSKERSAITLEFNLSQQAQEMGEKMRGEAMAAEEHKEEGHRETTPVEVKVGTEVAVGGDKDVWRVEAVDPETGKVTVAKKDVRKNGMVVMVPVGEMTAEEFKHMADENERLKEEAVKKSVEKGAPVDVDEVLKGEEAVKKGAEEVMKGMEAGAKWRNGSDEVEVVEVRGDEVEVRMYDGKETVGFVVPKEELAKSIVNDGMEKVEGEGSTGERPAADAAGTGAGGMRPADVSAGTGQAGTGQAGTGADGEKPAGDAAGTMATGEGTTGERPAADAAGTVAAGTGTAGTVAAGERATGEGTAGRSALDEVPEVMGEDGGVRKDFEKASVEVTREALREQGGDETVRVVAQQMVDVAEKEMKAAGSDAMKVAEAWRKKKYWEAVRDYDERQAAAEKAEKQRAEVREAVDMAVAEATRKGRTYEDMRADVLEKYKDDEERGKVAQQMMSEQEEILRDKILKANAQRVLDEAMEDEGSVDLALEQIGARRDRDDIAKGMGYESWKNFEGGVLASKMKSENRTDLEQLRREVAEEKARRREAAMKAQAEKDELMKKGVALKGVAADGTLVVETSGRVEFNVSSAKDELSRDYIKNVMISRGANEELVKNIFERLDAVVAEAERIASRNPIVRAWQQRDINALRRKPTEAEMAEMGGLLEKYGLVPKRSSFKNNGEYELNIDMGSLCTRREALDYAVRLMVKEGFAQNIGSSQLHMMKDVLKKYGYLVQCDVCFVEAKRARAVEQANDCEMSWNAICDVLGVRKDSFITDAPGRETEGRRPADVSAGTGQAGTGQAGTGAAEGGLTERQMEMLRRMAEGGDEVLEMIPERLRRRYDTKENYNMGMTADRVRRIARLMLEDPDLARRWKAEWNLDTVAMDEVMKRYSHTGLPNYLSSLSGAATAKPLEGYSVYDPLSWMEKYDAKNRKMSPEDKIRAVLGIGGVRGQSFTDFNPMLFLDYAQKYLDLEARMLPDHEYTKVPALIKLFGETGAMFNMSLVPAVDRNTPRELAGMKEDPNGDYLHTDGKRYKLIYVDESFPPEEAFKLRLRPEYGGRVGTICIGVSDAQIRHMLSADYIDMVIPYHASGVPEGVKVMTNLDMATDYTDYQNTNYNGKDKTEWKNDGYGAILDKKGDFSYNVGMQNLRDPRKVAKMYLKWCKANGFTPKFAQFADHENYYKLLEDFRGYDNNGKPVIQGSVKLRMPDDWKSVLDEALRERTEVQGRLDAMGDDKALMSELRGVLSKQRLDGEVRYVFMQKLKSVLGSNNVDVLNGKVFAEVMERTLRDEMEGKASAEDIESRVEVLRNRAGEVYGFCVGRRIVLNENRFNANTPAHEFTHIWSKVVRIANAKLWEKGKELLRQSEEWKDLESKLTSGEGEWAAEKAAYGRLMEDEDAMASEVLSRIVGDLNEQRIKELYDMRPRENAVGLRAKIMEWLEEMWGEIRSTFSGRVKDLTFEEFVQMPLRDLYDEGGEWSRQARAIWNKAKYKGEFGTYTKTMPKQKEGESDEAYAARMERERQKVWDRNERGRGMEEMRSAFKAAAQQDFGSAGTSINGNKLPSGFGLVDKQGGWVEGGKNLDMGGGRFDNATEMLKEKGVDNMVFDPYNRDEEHNRKVAEVAQNEGFETTTCNNCLNVINTKGARSNVILQCAKALKKGGVAYFTVYEGDGSGVGKVTQNGESWQENRRTEDYMDEIREHFGSVERKGKLIIAKDPKVDGKMSVWNYDASGEKGMEFAVESEGVSDADAVEKMMKERFGDDYKEKSESSNRLKGVVEEKRAKFEEDVAEQNEQYEQRKGMVGSGNFKNWFGDWQKDPEGSSKVVDAKGRPLVVYHGSPDENYGFTVFNTQEEGAVDNNIGSHFGGRDAADTIINENYNGGGIYEVYLDIKKPYETHDWFGQDDGYPLFEAMSIAEKHPETKQMLDDVLDRLINNGEDWIAEWREIYEEGGTKDVDDFVLEEAYLDNESSRDILYKGIRDMLEKCGYDGIKYFNDLEGEGECWVVFKPEQVKSAAIEGEMKNNGEFSRENKDIRFSRVGGDERKKIAAMDRAYVEAVNGGDAKKAEEIKREAAAVAMPKTKAVDKDGKPLKVFHANAVMEEWLEGEEKDDFQKPIRRFSRNNAWSGFWFSNDRGFAEGWVGTLKEEGVEFDEERITPAYLDMQNPYVIDAKGANYNNIDGKSSNEWAEWAEKNGYDGLIIRNVLEGDRESAKKVVDDYVVFRSEQIKSAEVSRDDNGRLIKLEESFSSSDDIRYSKARQDKLGFYSNAEKAVLDVKQEKATGDQWLAMLKKNGGLKAEEDKWMGLSEWLAGKKSVTKEEVLKFVRENSVLIHEVMYEENGRPTDEDVLGGRVEEVEEAMDELNGRFEELKDEFYEMGYEYDEDDPYETEATNYAKERLFEDWDEEYVDSVLNINGTGISVRGHAKDVYELLGLDMPENPQINDMRTHYQTEGLEDNKEIAIVAPMVERYEGSLPEIHFADEYTHNRAVAWCRFGDYEDSEGRRVLVIDEIQSQRHQDAREAEKVDKDELDRLKMEYEQADEEQRKAENERDDYAESLGIITRRMVMKDWRLKEQQTKVNGKIYLSMSAEQKAEMKRLDGVIAEKRSASIDCKAKYDDLKAKDKVVPDAPFAKNWHEVVMKRMLRYAAENGYDKVAWTDGHTQAERYSIGGVVESFYNGLDIDASNPLKNLDINMKNGKIIHLGVNKDGFVEKEWTGDGNEIGNSDFKNMPLSEIVGKEAAEKAMQLPEGEELMTEDLIIGGEGMKGFYDNMLVKYMNKYGKKWGVKVGEEFFDGLSDKASGYSVEKDGMTGLRMWTVPVTEEMKQSVMEEGQPYWMRHEEGLEKAKTEAERKATAETVRAVRKAVGGRNVVLLSDAEAREELRRMGVEGVEETEGKRPADVSAGTGQAGERPAGDAAGTGAGTGAGSNERPGADAAGTGAEKAELLKTSEGVVYGWKKDGKIWLTQDGLNANTPAHEYTHIWAESVKKNNPKLWENVKELMIGGKDSVAERVYREILGEEAYDDIKDDEDALASEVLSRLSGRKNRAEAEKVAQRMIDEAKGVWERAEAVSFKERMMRAVEKFWKWVGRDLFGLEGFESADEVADRVLYDLYKGTDLRMEGERTGEGRPADVSAGTGQAGTGQKPAGDAAGTRAGGEGPAANAAGTGAAGTGAAAGGERGEMMFVGRKGAEARDKAEGVSVRMDGMKAAEKMEKEIMRGKSKHAAKRLTLEDRKKIKFATGWERGRDGEWRYEEGGVKIKKEKMTSAMLSRLRAISKKNKPYLSDLIGADNELFKYYPGLMGVTVDGRETGETKGAWRYDKHVISLNTEWLKRHLDDLNKMVAFRDAYINKTKEYEAHAKRLKEQGNDDEQIEKDRQFVIKYYDEQIEKQKSYIDKDIDKIEEVLNHEIQHAIQREEGFANGGNPETVRQRMVRLMDMAEIGESERRVQRQIDVSKQLTDLERAKSLFKRPKSFLQMMEHFIYSGSKEDVVEKGQEISIDAYWNALNDVDYEAEAWGLDLADYGLDKLDEFYKNAEILQDRGMSYKDIAKMGMYLDEMIRFYTDAEKMAMKEMDGDPEKIREYKRLEKELKKADDYELYRKLAGEVEARNSAKRKDYTEEQRRGSLGEETEDVKREEQTAMWHDRDEWGDVEKETEGPGEEGPAADAAGTGADGERPAADAAGTGAGMRAERSAGPKRGTLAWRQWRMREEGAYDWKDYVAIEVGGGMKFRGEDSEDSATKGLIAHTTGKRKDVARFVAKKGEGDYPEVAAQRIWESMPEEMKEQCTDMDVMNEILDIVMTYKSHKEVMDGVEAYHTDRSEKELNEYEQDQKDRWAREQGYLDMDDYEMAQKDAYARRQGYRNFDELVQRQNDLWAQSKGYDDYQHFVDQQDENDRRWKEAERNRKEMEAAALQDKIDRANDYRARVRYIAQKARKNWLEANGYVNEEDYRAHLRLMREQSRAIAKMRKMRDERIQALLNTDQSTRPADPPAMPEGVKVNSPEWWEHIEEVAATINAQKEWDKKHPAETMDRTEAIKQIRAKISEGIKAEGMTDMDKRDLNQIMAALQKADVTTVNEMIDEANRIVNHIMLKSRKRQVQQVLKLKVQDQNGKGVRIAKNVDDDTRQLFKELEGSLMDTVTSGLEDKIHEIRRKNWKLRQEKKGADEDRLAEIEAEIEENNEMIDELTAKRGKLLKEGNNIAREDIDSQIMKLKADMKAAEDKALNDPNYKGGYEPSKADVTQLVALELKKMIKEGATLDDDIWEMEQKKRQAKAEKAALHDQYADEIQTAYEKANRAEATANDVDGYKALLNEYRAKMAAQDNKIKGINRMIVDMQATQAEKMEKLYEDLTGQVTEGKASLMETIMGEQKRRIEFISNALHDVRGVKAKRVDLKTVEKEHGKEGTVKSMFTFALNSFEYLCKAIAAHTTGEDTWMYRHFILGEEGVVAADINYNEGMQMAGHTLDGKVKEIFADYKHRPMTKAGKMAEALRDKMGRFARKKIETFDDWWEEMNWKPKEGDSTGITVLDMTDLDEHGVPTGSRINLDDMTLGQATYAYMVWKMADGRAKMEMMGFDDVAMKQVEEYIGSDNRAMADWVQDTFFADLREKYNEKHKEIYHTSMDAIENYVPLKILGAARGEEVDLSGDTGKGAGGLVVKTGALIARTHNTLPVDFNLGAAEVIWDHVKQMEEFNAYASVRRDLAWVLSSVAFRNQLNANSDGMYKRLLGAAEVAVRAERDQTMSVADRMMRMLQKPLASAAIAYRFGTAWKQTLSVPAFMGYTADPKFQLMLAKNIVGDYARNFVPISANMMSLGVLGKKMFEQAEAGEGVMARALGRNVRWCIYNLPDYRARVSLGVAGDNALAETIFDKTGRFKSRYAEIGMSPNKMVDAVTVAIGAKSVYDYEMSEAEKRVRGEMREIFEDPESEEAREWMRKRMEEEDRLAKIKATVCYNQSQQSNSPAFLSPMQTGKTFASSVLKLFKNSPISFARKASESVQDLHKMVTDYRGMTESYARNYLRAEGIVPAEATAEDWAEARSAARTKGRDAIVKASLNAVLFGYLLNKIWETGGKGFFGTLQDDDDDDEEKGWVEDAWGKVLEFAKFPMQGTLGMDLTVGLASGATNVMNFMTTSAYDQFLEDFKKGQEKFGLISPEVLGMVLAAGSKYGFGVDLNTWRNIYLGTERMIKDTGNAEDMMIDLMYMLNSPASGRASVAKNLYKKKYGEDWMNHVDEYVRDVERAMGYTMDDDVMESWMPAPKALQAATENRLRREFIDKNLTPEEKEAWKKNKEWEKRLKDADMMELEEMLKETDDPYLREKINSRYHSVNKKEHDSGKTTTEEIVDEMTGKGEQSEMQEWKKIWLEKMTADDMLVESNAKRRVAEAKKANDKLNAEMEKIADAQEREKFKREHKDELDRYADIAADWQDVNDYKQELDRGDEKRKKETMGKIRSAMQQCMRR